MRKMFMNTIFIMAALLLFQSTSICFPLQSVNAADAINVKMDGKIINLDTPPLLVDERVLVSGKVFFDALGMNTSMDEVKKVLTIDNSKVKILLPIGSKTVTVNNKTIELDVPAQLIDGKVMVPLRFISENAGCKVFWHSSSSTAVITSEKATASTIPVSIANGHFPDLAVDALGNIHVVYARDHYMYYKKFDKKSGKWEQEQSTDVWGKSGNLLPDKGFFEERSDPDIVIDSKNRPHVFCGSEYAYLDGPKWKKINPVAKADDPTRGFRDTELAIDSKDNIYLIHRGGYNGGNMGLIKLPAGSEQWIQLPDPDLPVDPNVTNHVYPDISIDLSDDSIHIVLRHATPKKVSYRASHDGGITWVAEGIWDKPEPESPHIIVDFNHNAFVTNGNGDFFKRTATGWEFETTAVRTPERTQPELEVDKKNNIYCTPWGGKFNIRDASGKWIGEKLITPNFASNIGFVETAGGDNFVYAIWEEGENLDSDMGAGIAEIVVGKILSDGTVTPIN